MKHFGDVKVTLEQFILEGVFGAFARFDAVSFQIFFDRSTGLQLVLVSRKTPVENHDSHKSQHGD